MGKTNPLYSKITRAVMEIKAKQHPRMAPRVPPVNIPNNGQRIKIITPGARTPPFVSPAKKPKMESAERKKVEPTFTLRYFLGHSENETKTKAIKVVMANGIGFTVTIKCRKVKVIKIKAANNRPVFIRTSCLN